LTIKKGASLTFFGKKTVDPLGILIFDFTGSADTFAGDIENNGLIRTTGTQDTTLSGDICGVGHVTVSTTAAAETFLRGDNTYSGGTDVDFGSFLTAHTQSIPTSGDRVINGTWTVDNTIADNYPAPITDNGLIQVIGIADVEFSGDISGSGTFLADSNGHTITLSGHNTYTSGTQIKAGTTLSAETHNLPAVGTITDSGVLLLTNKTFGVLTTNIIGPGNGIVRYVGTSDAQIAGNMSGGLRVEMNAPDQRLILSGTNTFTGGAFVNDGTLQVTTTSLPSTATNPDATVGPNGTLDFQNTAVGTYAGQILDDGTVIVTSTANTTLSGVISGIGKVVVDTPTPGVVTTLSGANTYLGGTIVEHGIAQARPVNLPVGAEANALIVRNTSVFNFIPNAASTFTGNILLEDLASKLVSAGPASLTISGAITGDGHVDVNGGNLTLTSAFNDYSGGTTVFAGNTLFGNTDALQGDIDVEGTVNFTQNIDGVFNGTVFSSAPGVGQVIKSGTGRMIVNTDSPNFQGITNVTGGIFDLNATWGGDVVSSNAKLTGNSHYKGNVSLTNNSVISPGDDLVIGTIFIDGNYSQDAISTYLADLGAHGESDRIYVGGDASLNGTLSFHVIDGTLSEKDTYLLMHIEGDLTGTFANVISDNNLFKYFVSYRDNIGSFDVLLNAKSIFHLCDGFNAIHIGDQFIIIANNPPSPILQEIIEEIAALAQEDDIKAICDAFEQMAGTQYLGMLVATELSGHKFLRQLYDPIRSIVTRTQPCRIYYDDPCCTSMCCEQWRPSLSAWLEAGGGHTTIHGSHRGTRGLKLDTYDITGGIQSSVTEDWTVGLAGSYAHDDVSYHLGGNGVNRTGFIGAYGLYRPNCWYFFGDLAYGYSMNSVHRRIDLGDLHFAPKGTPKVHQVQAYIEAGFDVPFCKFLIQPFLGFEANLLRRSKLSEKGGFPLNLVLSEKERSNLYSRLGVHLTTDPMCHRRFALSVDLAWQCRLNHLSDRAHERFQFFGDRFAVKGFGTTRNSFDGAATLTAFLGDNWELFVELAGEKWSNASSWDVIGGVKYSW
jgi:autotransporter-associated beta strand protein